MACKETYLYNTQIIKTDEHFGNDFTHSSIDDDNGNSRVNGIPLNTIQSTP